MSKNQFPLRTCVLSIVRSLCIVYGMLINRRFYVLQNSDDSPCLYLSVSSCVLPRRSNDRFDNLTSTCSSEMFVLLFEQLFHLKKKRNKKRKKKKERTCQNSKPRIVDIDFRNLLQFYKTMFEKHFDWLSVPVSWVTHLFPFAINKQQGDRLHHRKRYLRMYRRTIDNCRCWSKRERNYFRKIVAKMKNRSPVRYARR